MIDPGYLTELAAYGLIGAFVLALAERLVPIVPSYGLFIFLGSGMSAAPIDLLPLILVTTIASTLGAMSWYAIGNLLGEARTHALVVRFGRYVWLKEKLYLSLADRYCRNAFVATFVGQMVPVVRVYLSLPAGILRLPLSSFAAAVLLGSGLWIGGFTCLGYILTIFGWDPAVTTLIAVAVLLILEGGLAWTVSRRQSRA